MKVFAAYNSDGQVRRESSAGGVFSVLAQRIISEGGVVYGAAFDDNCRVVHRRVETLENLETLRRSKYAFSHLGSAIKDAVRDLQEGRKVLFCSVPCQVAAMRKLGGDHPNLLCVEVVCHGAPHPDYWQRYICELCKELNHKLSDIESINFRDKRTGWKNYSFSVKFNDGTEFAQLRKDNLFMKMFLSDYILREPCYNCLFKYPSGSHADITLGDLWGIEHIAPEINNDLGTTLVICRTEKGIEAGNHLENVVEIDFEGAAKYNPALISSAKKPLGYKIFKRMDKRSSSAIKLFKATILMNKVLRRLKRVIP